MQNNSRMDEPNTLNSLQKVHLQGKKRGGGGKNYPPRAKIRAAVQRAKKKKKTRSNERGGIK